MRAMSIDWQAVAQDVVNVAMEGRLLTYGDLAMLMGAHGLSIKPKTLARRLNRGTFDAGFFLFCLQILGVEQVALEDGDARPVLSEHSGWLAAHGLVQTPKEPKTQS